ncbi:unnamed protein product, partial [Ectocarpus sp. 13 AM-2016]
KRRSINGASGCLCCHCHVCLTMEDEWYSGADTTDGTGGGVGGALAGGGAQQRTPYGDSFTPPSSQGGIMAGQQAYGAPGASMGGYGGHAAAVVGGGGMRAEGVGGRGVGGGVVGAILEDEEDYENEPPLLEELGINFEHIWSKTLAVILPTKKIDINYLDDTDLAGPLVFCLCFGLCLLLTGKPHFGYIYGFGMFGCIATAMVLNLIGEKPIDLWKTTSVLGYCLLPVIGLAAMGIVTDLRGNLGHVLGFVAVAWCTISATRLFEEYLEMRRQRYLVAY